MEYFYTSRVSAALMIELYGMKFGQKIHGDIEYNCIIPKIGDKCKPITTVEEVMDCEGPFYVHPDSREILELRVNDIVQNPDGMTAVVASSAQFPGEVSLEVSKKFLGSAAVIIHRDGKPFIWPESEESHG